jgi:peptidoglycan-associated lipoprotein
MKKAFQSVLTVLVICSFLILQGCPKKVAPAKKTKVTRRVPPKVTPKAPTETPNLENETIKILPPITEEEIPAIAKLDESSQALLRDDKGNSASEMKPIYFDLDQWTIASSDMILIEQNTNWMIANPKSKVRVNGHGDSRGTNEYNLILGEKRAKAVRDSMVTLGVESSRLFVVSYGEERPFCVEVGDECLGRNRRVDYFVE